MEGVPNRLHILHKNEFQLIIPQNWTNCTTDITYSNEPPLGHPEFQQKILVSLLR